MTYEARLTLLKAKLRCHGVVNALSALSFAQTFHTGRRKDGSHEFSHQVEMGEMILQLPFQDGLNEALAVCFLHDVPEDYGVCEQEISDRFGSSVSRRVALLNKHVNPFCKISSDPISAIVKGVDRQHNLSTMDGAFDAAKQVSYQSETRQKIMPMLRDALSRHSSKHMEISRVINDLDLMISPACAHA